MSDLRVTDVQAALRHFAKEGGHDIINDPYKLKVDDKQYHSVHNRLYINNRNSSGYKHVYNLSSYIGHGETPVISHLHTEGNTKGLWGRSVSFLIPRLGRGTQLANALETGSHSSSWNQQSDSNGNDSFIENHPSGFWFPWEGGFSGRSFGKIIKNGKGNPVSETHELLARHAKGEVPERGHLVTNGDYKNREALTSDTFRLFNFQEATDRLTEPLPPRYSPHTPNMTYVIHRDGDRDMLGTYVYDHETEEMHRHE